MYPVTVALTNWHIILAITFSKMPILLSCLDIFSLSLFFFFFTGSFCTFTDHLIILQTNVFVKQILEITHIQSYGIVPSGRNAQRVAVSDVCEYTVAQRIPKQCTRIQSHLTSDSRTRGEACCLPWLRTLTTRLERQESLPCCSYWLGSSPIIQLRIHWLRGHQPLFWCDEKSRI